MVGGEDDDRVPVVAGGRESVEESPEGSVEGRAVGVVAGQFLAGAICDRLRDIGRKVDLLGVVYRLELVRSGAEGFVRRSPGEKESEGIVVDLLPEVSAGLVGLGVALRRRF